MLKTVQSIALAPVHVASLFTGAKSFKDNPVIGSPLLNRLGLHVARVAIAHGIVRLRRLMLFWLVDAEARRAFARDGFLKIENFLPEAEFEALRAEIRASREETRAMQQGDTATVTTLLDATALARLPRTRAVLYSRAFLNPTAYVGARWKHPLTFLHAVKNANVAAGADPQKTFHSDTFHATMKCWLFLDDVPARQGPFTYVPGSHRLSWARLKWEYGKSKQGRNLRDKHAVRGSLRVNQKDLKAMGFRDPVGFAVPANTLVIADTNGFHRRGDSPDPSSRLTIYGSSRGNPFNPWPGLPVGFWRAIEHGWRDWEYRRQDRHAAAAGRQPQWRRVPPETLSAPLTGARPELDAAATPPEDRAA